MRTRWLCRRPDVGRTSVEGFSRLVGQLTWRRQRDAWSRLGGSRGGFCRCRQGVSWTGMGDGLRGPLGGSRRQGGLAAAAVAVAVALAAIGPAEEEEEEAVAKLVVVVLAMGLVAPTPTRSRLQSCSTGHCWCGPRPGLGRTLAADRSADLLTPAVALQQRKALEVTLRRAGLDLRRPATTAARRAGAAQSPAHFVSALPVTLPESL